MAKQDVEMKEAPKQNDTAEAEEPQAEVSKEEKERLVLEGMPNVQGIELIFSKTCPKDTLILNCRSSMLLLHISSSVLVQCSYYKNHLSFQVLICSFIYLFIYLCRPKRPGEVHR